jgi:aminopeptidase N
MVAGTRAAWAAALALSACGSGGSAPDATPDAPGPPPDARVPSGTLAPYDVTHYDYALDMDAVRATARVDLVTRGAGDCVAIGFRPDAAESVSIDGAPALGVQIVDDVLRACDGVGDGWNAEESLTLEVVADVPFTTWDGSQVGYSVWNDLRGNPYTYLVSWVGGCDRHGPCDARADRFATYRFTVDHPSGTQVLCPGVVTPGETRTVCDFLYDGGPTYSTFSIMASQSWTTRSLGDWGGVDVVLYDYVETGIGDAFDVDTVAGFFDWMQTTFGAYAYGTELRFAVGPTYWAGFEHPGNISLSEGLALGGSSYRDGLLHTTLHEVAHQWAGDRVTLADTYDFVWKEAMAEYLTFVYEAQALPPDYADYTARAWKTFSFYAAYHLVPDERPPLLDYYGDVYGPGPMILFRQLEGLYDRDAVMAALVSLIGGGESRAISVADVQGALEAATGADLDAYFDAWAFGAGAPAWPRASASWVAAPAGGLDVSVDVTTSDGVPRGCAFTLQLTGAPGQTFDVPVSTGLAGNDPAPIHVDPAPPFTPTDYQIDPYAECLIWRAAAGKPGQGDDPPRARVNPWLAPRYPR